MDYENDNDNEEDLERIMLNKIENLEKKILHFLNSKLNVSLTGKEIKIDLNHKNIGNIELQLLTGINFKNLEELNLSNNNISDIKLLKEFNLNKIKKLDLSFNKINDLKDKTSNKTIDLNIDQDNLICKDIEEIKKLINDSESKEDEYYDPYDILNNSCFMTSYYNDTSKNEKKEYKKKLLNKIDNLEKKVLGYFNSKLNINLTGKEIKIDLNNKNIGNIDLDLLSGVEFKKLEEINLSHNNISNIESLPNFKTVKRIDISFNKIKDITPIKQLTKNNKKLENLNLGNNEIMDVKILKENIFTTVIDINLDNNNIIKKDIEEIKDIIKKNNEEKLCRKNEDFRNNEEKLCRKNEDFRKYYEILNPIERLYVSNIYEGINKETHEKRFIQIVKKEKIKSKIEDNMETIKMIKEEDIQLYIDKYLNLINKMRILMGDNKDNKNTVKFYESYNTNEELAIIMETWDDNLYQFLEKKEGHLNYKEIYEILTQLNNSFRIMAQNKLIHGSLKLENIVINYENEEKSKFIVQLKSDICQLEDDCFGELINLNCRILAPEILKGENNFEKCDLWSLGIMIYNFYFKEYPYKGKYRREVLDEIKEVNKINKKTGDSDLDDLIIKLLECDPKKRISWEDYFNHPFFLRK